MIDHLRAQGLANMARGEITASTESEREFAYPIDGVPHLYVELLDARGNSYVCGQRGRPKIPRPSGPRAPVLWEEPPPLVPLPSAPSRDLLLAVPAPSRGPSKITRLVAQKILAAFDQINAQQAGNNQVSLERLRRAVMVPRAQFDRSIELLRGEELTLSVSEGRLHRVSDELLRAGIREPDGRGDYRVLVYASRRD